MRYHQRRLTFIIAVDKLLNKEPQAIPGVLRRIKDGEGFLEPSPKYELKAGLPKLLSFRINQKTFLLLINQNNDYADG